MSPPADNLRVVNAQLRADLARARTLLAERDAEIVALRAEVSRLSAEKQALTAANGKLVEALAMSNDRITELLAAKRRPARPEPKPKPPAPAPDVTEEDAARFDARPRPPEPKPKEKPEPVGPTHTGRHPLPAHLPVDGSTRLPPCCEGCGSTELDIVDEVVERKLTVVREHQRVRETHRKVGRCKRCRKRTTAEAPPAPFARSKVTCEWLAWLIVQKFYMLMPLDRIRRYLALQGIVLSISFLVAMVREATTLVDVVDGEHWKQLLAGGWMQTDGTTLKVLIPGLEEAYNGYLEVYRRDDLVVFQYEATKDGAIVEAKLAPFHGVLVSDAEHRFNGVYVDGREEGGCNAHGRRKLREAEQVQPDLAAEGGKFITALYALEDDARERGLTGSELRTWRQTHTRPLMDRFRAWIDAVLPTLTPSDKLAGVLRYYQNHWDALTRFIDHPEIPPDNSACEREFQNVAKARLNWLFAGSTEGAHRAAALLGVLATARHVGVNLEAYLTWLFERRGTHRHHHPLPASALTPAAYKIWLEARTPPGPDG